jgi:hypothetical protein
MSALMKIKITRPIIVAGEDANEGDLFELPRGKAVELIGAGCAEEYLEPGEKSARPDALTTVETVTHADPQIRRIPPAPKVSKKKDDAAAAGGGAPTTDQK